MADNYLERRRRDYEERKAAWLRKKKLHPVAKRPSGHATADRTEPAPEE